MRRREGTSGDDEQKRKGVGLREGTGL